MLLVELHPPTVMLKDGVRWVVAVRDFRERSTADAEIRIPTHPKDC